MVLAGRQASRLQWRRCGPGTVSEWRLMPDLEIVKRKYERSVGCWTNEPGGCGPPPKPTALGYGGIGLVAAATGLAPNTIRQGLEELQRQESNPATKVPVEEDQRVCGRPVVERDRVRRPGGGAKFAEVKDPGILAVLDSLPSDEVAGDPMSEQRWVRSSLRNLSSRLKEAGHEVSPGTVSRLLKVLGLSLKTTKRTVLRKNCPGREEQFRYIAAPRGAFTAAGLPVASVDTKKKELIGDFRNSGQSWCRKRQRLTSTTTPARRNARRSLWASATWPGIRATSWLAPLTTRRSSRRTRLSGGGRPRDEQITRRLSNSSFSPTGAGVTVAGRGSGSGSFRPNCATGSA